MGCVQLGSKLTHTCLARLPYRLGQHGRRLGRLGGCIGRRLGREPLSRCCVRLGRRLGRRLARLPDRRLAAPREDLSGAVSGAVSGALSGAVSVKYTRPREVLWNAFGYGSAHVGRVVRRSHHGPLGHRS